MYIRIANTQFLAKLCFCIIIKKIYKALKKSSFDLPTYYNVFLPEFSKNCKNQSFTTYLIILKFMYINILIYVRISQDR